MIVDHKEVEGQCAEPEEMEVCRLDGCKENSSLLVCCNKSPITPSSYHSYCFSYKLLLNTFCILSINQAFLIMSMSALPHPLSLPLIQNFLLTVPSPQTRGSIVFPDMPWSPRPSMHLHSVCVCVCVPVREQLSHSAITCRTAETERYLPRQLPPSLSLLPSFINKSIQFPSVFPFC